MKTRAILNALTCVTAICCGSYASRADEAAPTAVAEVAAAPAVEAAAASSVQPTIDYVETDIQAALRQLASRAGISLIMGDEVVGKVTVHLEGVPYEDAMRLIAESKGFAYAKDKNVAKVKSREAVDTEPVELRVCTLSYAKAEDLKKSLELSLTGRGKMQVDARSNTLIVSDTPTNLAQLMPLINALDTQTPQVMIEAKFVETTKNPKKDLGFDWTSTLLDHEFSASGEQIDPITGATINGFSFTKNLAGGPWTPATALLNAGQAKVVFSYLNRDTDTELLANPRVVTTDNSKAKIAIARQVPIPIFTFSETTASLQISGFEYKDIGIILTVTPRINKNDYITLDVSPEASNQAGNQPLTSGEGNVVNIPIVSTRTATTTVLIKSGNTLAIGGLMQQDVENTYTKTPVLGDIPGLGAMFRSKKLTKSKRDLIIFLTPTIVGPDAQTGYEKFVNGLPNEEVYVDDKWMPKDNAKPRSLPLPSPTPATPDKATGPAEKNFTP